MVLNVLIKLVVVNLEFECNEVSYVYSQIGQQKHNDDEDSERLSAFFCC